ncbi:DNA-binding transcriptional regulator SgrR of sgrS sRNA, contains a MarR-type HTH domain and a solute-binding domain [Kosakonia arachidis]|uniref:DNA-binding transcriptional regulator SgrR of sgrS sRNA, contains a MarR-type HTH domain and a solute-binding domain n=1 Tax=Kosakonia arachidis TaxID=551989 RepID=A0A1I6XU46_9ENTR|nr:SgrR family transcriptional regulator [Kosakonia arachidis]SFT41958.1 DNA-binding transcriptional regulator SgrR of sgrS sRNA, contains a MarR-type HTH domain and a solute-binding domain [Kosakonia arachidis]
MRLLNRLNQYQRLWQISAGKTQSTSVTELAEQCFCSARHMRTLLHQMQDAGWLRWQSQSGRGKRGELQLLIAPESIRSQMLEQALNSGQQQNALALAQIAPDDLRTLLNPFLGGLWQNETPTLRIPYYRPLDPLVPGFLPGRAEQHLAGQIFSGLTRFVSHNIQPQGDLAHHWDVSADGLCWRFHLHVTLHWHNGDTVTAAQLQESLQQLLQLPALQTLFSSVASIEITHPWCLTFKLHRHDFWLPYRLASYGSRLAHPQQPMVGTGPFRLVTYSRELVRLESHDHYHLGHPFLKAVEFWITPQLFEQDLGTSCRHPVQIAIGEPDELHHLQPVSNGISLGFCYLAQRPGARLNPAQSRRLVQIIHHTSLVQTLPLDENLITPSRELLPGWQMPEWPAEQVPLPEKLTLLYHLPVELHIMAEQLRLYLATIGCELTVIFHDSKNWDGCTQLATADLMMGDRLIGETPEYTLEQWLRCDPLWPNLLSAQQFAHLQATLNAVQRQANEQERYQALHDVFDTLMDNATLTPLFNYQYRISAPPGVEGIHLNTRGWFDFAEAWLPAPAR